MTQTNLEYDGLGHYRKTEVDGNLDATGNQKTTFVNYNPGSGTAPGAITIQRLARPGSSRRSIPSGPKTQSTLSLRTPRLLRRRSVSAPRPEPSSVRGRCRLQTRWRPTSYIFFSTIPRETFPRRRSPVAIGTETLRRITLYVQRHRGLPADPQLQQRLWQRTLRNLGGNVASRRGQRHRSRHGKGHCQQG